MNTESNVLLVTSIIMGVSALLLFFISYRQHKENGFIFTNAWIWASKQERERMDERVKKAEYRVARNVFFMLGVLFSIFAVNFHLGFSWLYYVGYALMGCIPIYAIVQCVRNYRYYASIGHR